MSEREDNVYRAKLAEQAKLDDGEYIFLIWLTIELGTHLHLTSFIAEVNNRIYHITERGFYFTFMFLMGYSITLWS